MSNTLADLSVQQLRQALNIREKIDELEAQLAALVGSSGTGAIIGKKGKRTMSPSAKAKIGAAQKARWAKTKGERVEKPAKKGRRKMSPAAKAKMSAAAKKRWKAAKAAGKKTL
jgi:hypothetical protein